MLRTVLKTSSNVTNLLRRNYAIRSSSYIARHIGADQNEQNQMLKTLGLKSSEELLENVIPSHIRLNKDEQKAIENVVGTGAEEVDALQELQNKMNQNVVNKSYIGMGYYDCLTPTPILRNIIENPSWYTPYTPYQAEIAQGRLEMLMNFQTMVRDLVGKQLSNASLLDESTACAEAMAMALNICKKKLKKQTPKFIVSKNLHPQNIAVIQTRAEPLGIEVEIVDDSQFVNKLSEENVFGAIVQYPDTLGQINENLGEITKIAHSNNVIMSASTDLLACSAVKPPGEFGVDIVVGSAQRFGVPLGYGGPHAAFLATNQGDEKRKMPGRIIGLSKDTRNMPAYRMGWQVREQHIRKDKATSNICTAQALLANVSAAYAVYHGPNGIKQIGQRVHNYCKVLEQGLNSCNNVSVYNKTFFDTITVDTKGNANNVINNGYKNGINLRCIDDNLVGIALDETTTLDDINVILQVFGASNPNAQALFDDIDKQSNGIPQSMKRTTLFMQHDHFKSYHSETALMRYLYNLEKKDLGLNTAMIPLGSCTMKLNSANVMIPVTWPTVNKLHPFAPLDQCNGYKSLIDDMERWLAAVTGFDSVSLQPNSGAQGEYTGLLTIRAYHTANGEQHRNICLIPNSAHGTNPASAAMCGLKVKLVQCDDNGYVDLDDLRKKVEESKDALCSIMITYPSTYGIFEDYVMEVCDIVHKNGGLVYMDGANLQAQLGFTSPGKIGADVCHLNLHKTFCIPHGGGGPGLGPIAVNKKLAPFLPTHPIVDSAPNSANSIGAIAAGPFSSASILVIPWMYMRMMGFDGLCQATTVAILNANYMAKRLEKHWPILYRRNGFCAHEFIIDVNKLNKKCGILEKDVAKRLMDYSFHAPTMSWPVVKTLMCEPTESEPFEELNRLCDALISIRKEVQEIEDGTIALEDSPVRCSPHTIDMIASSEWDRKYSREQAVVDKYKPYWPSVGRIDDVWGDRHNMCECPTVEDIESMQAETDSAEEKEY